MSVTHTGHGLSKQFNTCAMFCLSRTLDASSRKIAESPTGQYRSWYLGAPWSALQMISRVRSRQSGLRQEHRSHKKHIMRVRRALRVPCRKTVPVEIRHRGQAGSFCFGVGRGGDPTRGHTGQRERHRGPEVALWLSATNTTRNGPFNVSSGRSQCTRHGWLPDAKKFNI